MKIYFTPEHFTDESLYLKYFFNVNLIDFVNIDEYVNDKALIYLPNLLISDEVCEKIKKIKNKKLIYVLNGICFDNRFGSNIIRNMLRCFDVKETIIDEMNFNTSKCWPIDQNSEFTSKNYYRELAVCEIVNDIDVQKSHYLLLQSKIDLTKAKKSFPQANMIYMDKWLYEYKTEIVDRISESLGINQKNYEYFDANYIKIFSCFIRRFTEKRFKFICELVDRDIINKTHYTFSLNYGKNCTEQVEDYLVENIVKINTKSDKINEWVKTLPCILDEEITNPYPLSLQYFYHHSEINIIFETFVDYTDEGTNYLEFVSEKTWKAIFHRKPFIIISIPFTLKYLKDLGFKTFDFFIDESYDNILDYDERIKKVVEEIDRLSDLSFENLTNKNNGLRSDLMLETTYHNFNLLMEMMYKQSPFTLDIIND